VLKQLISKSTPLLVTTCVTIVQYIQGFIRIRKKTIAVLKHLQENKSDNTNLQSFPQSKDVERIHNSIYSLLWFMYRASHLSTSVSLAFQFSLHTRHANSTPFHSVIAPKPQNFFIAAYLR